MRPPAPQAFINNFQEAKEALAEVTVQAAEKAASGVKELAERSTRIALNVHFNAPLIFMPQSSTSTNVIVADLGRLSVRNRFATQPYKSNAAIPPVVDIMAVKLTDLKMYRSALVVCLSVCLCGCVDRVHTPLNVSSTPAFHQEHVRERRIPGRDATAESRQPGPGDPEEPLIQLVSQHSRHRDHGSPQAHDRESC